MSEITLVYTGPLDECGLEGKGGRSYLVRPLEPFVVDPEDAAWFLGKFPGIVRPFESEELAAPEPEPQGKKHRARNAAPDDQEARADSGVED